MIRLQYAYLRTCAFKYVLFFLSSLGWDSVSIISHLLYFETFLYHVRKKLLSLSHDHVYSLVFHVTYPFRALWPFGQLAIMHHHNLLSLVALNNLSIKFSKLCLLIICPGNLICLFLM